MGSTLTNAKSISFIENQHITRKKYVEDNFVKSCVSSVVE